MDTLPGDVSAQFKQPHSNFHHQQYLHNQQYHQHHYQRHPQQHQQQQHFNYQEQQQGRFHYNNDINQKGELHQGNIKQEVSPRGRRPNLPSQHTPSLANNFQNSASANVNSASTTAPSGLSPFYLICLHCKAMFPTQQEYDSHTSFCQSPKISFQCNTCSFTSDSVSYISEHVKLHPTHYQQKYPCDLCSTSFKTPSGLRLHKQVKHKDKPTLSCELCGKIMYSKINLEGHMNQHNGLKPHNCHFCTKSFSYKQSLKAHEKLCPFRPFVKDGAPENE